MSDLFKDAFTGRMLEDIVQKFDEEGKECYEFSFSAASLFWLNKTVTKKTSKP